MAPERPTPTGPSLGEALDADETHGPGHPAVPSNSTPSAGEELSRGGEELATPGEDALVDIVDDDDVQARRDADG